MSGAADPAGEEPNQAAEHQDRDHVAHDPGAEAQAEDDRDEHPERDDYPHRQPRSLLRVDLGSELVDLAIRTAIEIPPPAVVTEVGHRMQSFLARRNGDRTR